MDDSKKRELADNEELINWLNHSISDFMVTVTSRELTGDVSEYIGRLFHVISDLERIGDHAENIAEWVIYSITGSHKSIENGEVL